MNTTKTHLRGALTVLAVTGFFSACEQVEQVQDQFRDLTPHERYQASLDQAGLAETALAREWSEAGARAVDEPLSISLPYEERGFISPDDPDAMGYLVEIPRGRRLTAEVSLDTEEGTRVFVDLFRVAADEEDPARPLISTDSIPGAITHEPWRGGEFVLRLQPELLRGGQYTVTLRLEAQLTFPVDGHGVRAVQSRFGVPREGGRRSHNGVDIFAPRGTPVLAAAEGRVRRVEVTNLGGKVVWLRDPARNANLYYAHLDSQHVSDGQRVASGDTVGFVGNTGNARTTPPHLHFGLYRRGEGPVDPFPFLDPPPEVMPEMTGDLDRLGSWVRVESDGIHLRSAPSLRAEILGELEQYTPLRVLGGAGDYFRVQLPDGAQGYVAARLTETVEQPVAEDASAVFRTVRMRPREDAPVMATLAPGDPVSVLGRFGEYLYVRGPRGRGGWIGAASDE
ncbi:MAG: M23 family metallopeptidase [Gemmatimonadota bacterium]|nr:M23 family metallopeptidase [Gemmatimonadota bacterium]